LLGQANHALYKEFEGQVRAAGLSSIEWRVLATLHDGGPLTVSQLAREVLAKQPTVTKLVQRMNEQGWVAVQADPADQRRTFVGATVLLAIWCALRGVKLFGRDGTLPAGLLAGALFAAEFACIYLGLRDTTASRLTVFLYTSPFFVALLVPRFVPAERLRPLQ